MNPAAFVSRRRRSLLTLLSMLIAAGLVAAFVMPVSLFPNVLFPRIAVTIDAGDREEVRAGLVEHHRRAGHDGA